ncbi:MAG: hypothetical protein ABJF07_26585, partial [Nisaea sp.]|uniref:tyrosine-type recombinase/integrase n=1 Tax=Nisaea sp. TaxID=2024842 RepID=UPI0032675D4E
MKRDQQEVADNLFWSEIVSAHSDPASIQVKYEQAVRRAEGLGFRYRPSMEIAQGPIEDIIRRVQALPPASEKAQPIEAALLGREQRPQTSLSEALDLYINEIAKTGLSRKSPAQKNRWINERKRAVLSFVKLIGDKPIEDITRDDARAYFRHWLERVAPDDQKAKQLSASTANRSIGLLKKLYGSYFQHIAEFDRPNPFRNLNFAENEEGKRPPFSAEWIEKEIFALGALERMNREARGLTLALADTGARMSELCNLPESAIVLDHPVPHINIRPSFDREQPREIKTASSVRTIPLVGVALSVFQAHPAGFPRYRDKEASLSAEINKFLRKHRLFPTPKHTAYSFRHAFEDRMKVAGIDFELRCILMGHSMDRPEYGQGGSLEWQRDELR